MNEFEKKIFNFCKEENLFSDCTGLILAVSGGPDSMAMLRFFFKNEKHFSFPILCATVDHSIREESEEEAAYIEEYCRKNNIKFEKLKKDVPKLCPKNTSLETFSREVRYDFFRQISLKYGYSHIATAHTSDDNAETVIMNIVRGSGLSGLCGIPVKREDNVVRPFLSAEKSELIKYCNDEKVKYYIDKTNAENIYRRNIIRNTVIPLLEKENPSIRKTLNRLSRSAKIEESFLSTLSEKAFGDVIKKKDKITIPFRLFEDYDKSIVFRVIRKAFSSLSDKELTFEMTESVFSLYSEKKTSDKVQLFDLFAVKSYDSIDITKKTEKIQPLQINTKINTKIPFFDGIVMVKKRQSPYKKNINCIKPIDLEGSFLRNRREGDIFNNTKNGNKPLRRMYIDKKIPADKRDFLPVLEKNGEIVWAAQLGTAFKFRADNCEEFYEMVFNNFE